MAKSVPSHKCPNCNETFQRYISKGTIKYPCCSVACAAEWRRKLKRLTLPAKKKCPKCGETKPTTTVFFHKSKQTASGLAGWCIKCHNADTNSRNKDEKHKLRHKAYRDANPERLRVQKWKESLKRQYGITPDDFAKLLEQQNGKCALCGVESGRSKGGRLCIDHVERGNEKVVRGLLCFSCNTSIGRLGDNVIGLARALVYVARHEEIDGGSLDNVVDNLDNWLISQVTA